MRVAPRSSGSAVGVQDVIQFSQFGAFRDEAIGAVSIGLDSGVTVG
jgi:hypothetical protein